MGNLSTEGGANEAQDKPGIINAVGPQFIGVMTLEKTAGAYRRSEDGN
jgi:hypothetical protein